jgi:hypothetical protein
MDIQKFFDVGMKAMNFIKTAAQSGKDVSVGVTAMTNIFSKRPEDITDAELDDTEAKLDAEMDRFEESMTKLKK